VSTIKGQKPQDFRPCAGNPKLSGKNTINVARFRQDMVKNWMKLSLATLVLAGCTTKPEFRNLSSEVAKQYSSEYSRSMETVDELAKSGFTPERANAYLKNGFSVRDAFKLHGENIDPSTAAHYGSELGATEILHFVKNHVSWAEVKVLAAHCAGTRDLAAVQTAFPGTEGLAKLQKYKGGCDNAVAYAGENVSPEAANPFAEAELQPDEVIALIQGKVSAATATAYHAANSTLGAAGIIDLIKADISAATVKAYNGDDNAADAEDVIKLAKANVSPAAFRAYTAEQRLSVDDVIALSAQVQPQTYAAYKKVDANISVEDILALQGKIPPAVWGKYVEQESGMNPETALALYPNITPEIIKAHRDAECWSGKDVSDLPELHKVLPPGKCKEYRAQSLDGEDSYKLAEMGISPAEYKTYHTLSPDWGIPDIVKYRESGGTVQQLREEVRKRMLDGVSGKQQ
jgi:hypothetical protein